ncbi:TIGR04255 family protein [Pararobbsia alpina]|uniref:TIGR04255 family protein n=1 Tax=Pararobbsia alpina TaxID=621374 RepID=UPI0039A4F370
MADEAPDSSFGDGVESRVRQRGWVQILGKPCRVEFRPATIAPYPQFRIANTTLIIRIISVELSVKKNVKWPITELYNVSKDKESTMPSLGSWSKAPLAYVVAELRLASILNIEPLAAALQEPLTPNFPRLHRAHEFGFLFDTQAGVARQQTSPRYHFLSADGSACVVLTPDVLGLHVSKYTDSSGFIAMFAGVLNALGAVRSGQFIERLGLRYWDIVLPENGMKVSDFFTFDVSTLVEPLPGSTMTRDVHEIAYSISQPIPHVAVSRFSLTASPLAPMPPNFSMIAEIEPSARLQESRELGTAEPTALVGYLDVDVSAPVQQALDIDGLVATAQMLHMSQSSMFKKYTSVRGQTFWKEGEK